MFSLSFGCIRAAIIMNINCCSSVTLLSCEKKSINPVCLHHFTASVCMAGTERRLPVHGYSGDILLFALMLDSTQRSCCSWPVDLNQRLLAVMCYC